MDNLFRCCRKPKLDNTFILPTHNKNTSPSNEKQTMDESHSTNNKKSDSYKNKLNSILIIESDTKDISLNAGNPNSSPDNKSYTNHKSNNSPQFIDLDKNMPYTKKKMKIDLSQQKIIVKTQRNNSFDKASTSKDNSILSKHSKHSKKSIFTFHDRPLTSASFIQVIVISYIRI